MEEQLSIRMILTLLQSEYPGSFAHMDQRTMTLKVKLWETEFKNDNIQLVYAAVRLYMKKPEQFAPTIGQIRENMHILLNADKEEMTDQKAWLLVSKACANGIHHSREEFEKLPSDVQAAVGGPEQLKAWAMMDAETVESVISSNFKKTYRVTQEREKQLAQISPEVRQMIAGISGGMQLEAKETPRLAPHETLIPAKLEPMIPFKKPQEAEKTALREEYKPPSAEEWAKKREEAMNRLLGGAE